MTPLGRTDHPRGQNPSVPASRLAVTHERSVASRLASSVLATGPARHQLYSYHIAGTSARPGPSRSTSCPRTAPRLSPTGTRKFRGRDGARGRRVVVRCARRPGRVAIAAPKHRRVRADVEQRSRFAGLYVRHVPEGLARGQRRSRFASTQSHVRKQKHSHTTDLVLVALGLANHNLEHARGVQPRAAAALGRARRAERRGIDRLEQPRSSESRARTVRPQTARGCRARAGSPHITAATASKSHGFG